MNFRLDSLFNFKIATLAERKYRISQDSLHNNTVTVHCKFLNESFNQIVITKYERDPMKNGREIAERR